MPPGWFSTKQPVRIQLNALPPFSWSHDVTLELGLGSAGDVQLAAPLPEGSSFALDQASPDAYVTLNLDTCLPQNPKRRAGIVWLRLSRSDLASPWTLAFQKGADGGVPIRGVLVPVVQSVDVQPTGTKITLSDADDVLGVKFVGQALPVVPQLAPGVPKGILATFQAPPGATEFDLLMRDASDGVIHVTIVKVPK
jgi:hypothetical protein